VVTLLTTEQCKQPQLIMSAIHSNYSQLQPSE